MHLLPYDLQFCLMSHNFTVWQIRQTVVPDENYSQPLLCAHKQIHTFGKNHSLKTDLACLGSLLRPICQNLLLAKKRQKERQTILFRNYRCDVGLKSAQDFAKNSFLGNKGLVDSRHLQFFWNEWFCREKERFEPAPQFQADSLSSSA